MKNNISIKMYFSHGITKTECDLRLNRMKPNVSRLFSDMGSEWSIRLLAMRWVKFKTQVTPLFSFRPS